MFPKFRSNINSSRIKTLNPCISMSRFCHSKVKVGFDSLNQPSAQNNVTIFSDLDNKTTYSIPPFEVVVELKTIVSSFEVVGILKEVKLRCLKYVSVVDVDDGALKRVANVEFSWIEILMGKAKKEAISVARKWKDRDSLKRLELTYNPEVERKLNGSEDMFDDESEDRDFDTIDDENMCDYMLKGDYVAWWELDVGSDVDPLEPRVGFGKEENGGFGGSG